MTRPPRRYDGSLTPRQRKRLRYEYTHAEELYLARFSQTPHDQTYGTRHAHRVSARSMPAAPGSHEDAPDG